MNSGIARGCGWQTIGAYVNLAAFYCIGVPCAIILGFVFHMKAKVKYPSHLIICF